MLYGRAWALNAIILCIAAQAAGTVKINYPLDGSVFPRDFAAPTFIFRDTSPAVTQRTASWVVDITFPDAAPSIRVKAAGERLRVGPIDLRCVGPTNKPPALTPEQASARTWKPDERTWAAIKQHTAATITISASGAPAAGRGSITIRTAPEPVGAPIFYRDVPLMPSQTEKGVIKPLASNALPLIAWRLRNVADSSSRVVMHGLHTCANCHSASTDGKTLGLDVDGPQNDKGLYAIVPINRETSIQNENVVAWSTFRGKLGGKLRVGFMSQVSPDGRHVVTTINDNELDESEYQRRKSLKEVVSNYYVANFKDYRFLQVFYPTRGILAWYNRDTGRLQPLPGADDPRYVHTNAVWSPDGKYLVFARAEARDPYPAGSKIALAANDPNETQIRYDLYRIPFNDGKGGQAEPITGASANGMSNSFPKVSPDGKWIVYVQSRNGQLMRPDSRLHIVAASGGTARLMRCNTDLMNSWHSFSPNGRWMVFSSKSRSPYTQMFLTRIDEDGNDSPAILIENSTAANRAVNIPEFLNIPPDTPLSIDAPVADYYRVIDVASELLNKRQYEAAIQEWNKAVELNPGEALPRNNLGFALAEIGRTEEAVAHYTKALELSPEYPEAHNNLGEALVRLERVEEAIVQFEQAARLKPRYANAHSNLGAALARQGRIAEAIPQFRLAIEYNPATVDAHNNLAVSLAIMGQWQEALPHLQQAAKLSGGQDPMILDLEARAYAETARFPEAARTARQALAIAARRGDRRMLEALKMRLGYYESGRTAPM